MQQYSSFSTNQSGPPPSLHAPAQSAAAPEKILDRGPAWATFSFPFSSLEGGRFSLRSGRVCLPRRKAEHRPGSAGGRVGAARSPQGNLVLTQAQARLGNLGAGVMEL